MSMMTSHNCLLICYNSRSSFLDGSAAAKHSVHVSFDFSHPQGSSFDSDAKSWRLFADVVNDIGEHKGLMCLCVTSLMSDFSKR